MSKKIIRVPITNIYDGNDYSAEILIGSGKTKANVILDTGSSTLAVKPSAYKVEKDSDAKPTTYAQLVQYGTGGWAGPVVNTSLSMGLPGNTVTLQNAPLAISDVQQRGNFTGVDGILGLAYNSLNDAYDLRPYFVKYGISPAVTLPWPFPSHSFKKFIVQFGRLVQTEKIAERNLIPYFTELESAGVTANKFSFHTRRSWIHYKNAAKTGVADDPLNNGFFVLGGGEEQTDLFSGSFLTVKVEHDLYYNTNLKAVQVAGRPAVEALPLQQKYKQYMSTNSIVDSGTSYLALSGDVFQAILHSLNDLNPKYIDLIRSSEANGIPVNELNKVAWPKIDFIFSGEKNEDVRLTCTPQTYWQVNFPEFGMATFQIGGPSAGEDQNQSIFGLPLLNNYYTIFDRSKDRNGVIKFASIK